MEKPRGITMANNWKMKEIKTIMILKEEMIKNNINEDMIKEFMDEQYDIINNKYNERIERYNKNKEKKLEKDKESIEKKTKIIKRENAVNFLIKNKMFLEDNGVNKKYIKDYTKKQYDEINKIYSNE
jgi:hypothetical protein